MAPIDFQKMRKELISLYEKFLESPDNHLTYNEVVDYHIKFGGLVKYNEYLKSQPVPKDIVTGLYGLSTIYMYKFYEKDEGIFSNEEIIVTAKRILQDLKKEDR